MKIIGLALSILLSCTVCAEIKEIHQIRELEGLAFESGDWFLFDIDYTLVEPDHPALRMTVIKQNRQRFLDELAKFDGEQKELIPALMLSHVSGRLTDPLVPSLIRKLQQDGVTVFGFTAADTSIIPDVGALPVWRSAELKKLDIQFAPDSLPKERIEFTSFAPFRGTYPLYQDGILYSNVIHSKGSVLAAFLDRVCQMPSKIIFVDDTLENLQSVEMEMKKRAIPFLGIHYKVRADETTLSKVSDEEWKKVWDGIRERAEKIAFPEGILETGQAAAIHWACGSMPEKSLIIFDVGNVLLVHEDAVLSCHHRPWIRDWVARETGEMDRNYWRALSAIIDREAGMNLVNPMLPAIFNEGKQKGTVLILSKFWCGPSGEKGSFEEQRIASLKKVGIHPEESFPKVAGWHQKELEATYSHGLIQTEALLKGPVLEAFLKQADWMPKAILFVDDRKDQCESVAATAKALGIPALCIQYTEEISRVPSLDPAIADLQMRTLVNEHRWISDEAARKQLQDKD